MISKNSSLAKQIHLPAERSKRHKRPMIQHSGSVHVSLAHRYWNGLWSHEQNRRIYGDSASEEGVGSNLRVDIGLLATCREPLTNALTKIKAVTDHRCLFEDVPRFQKVPSTLERITQYLAEHVFAQSLEDGQWLWLDVHENGGLVCRARPHLQSMELTIKVRNLSLQIKGLVQEPSGLLIERSAASRAVDCEFLKVRDIKNSDESAWAHTLFENLQIKVKGLSGMAVDLGCHRTIAIQSHT